MNNGQFIDGLNNSCKTIFKKLAHITIIEGIGGFKTPINDIE